MGTKCAGSVPHVLLGLILMSLAIDIIFASGTKHEQHHVENKDSNSAINQANVTSTKGKNLTRKSRSPQYSSLGGLTRPQVGLGQLGLPYTPRLSPALGLQTAPSLQSLGQLRGIIPQDNRLLANTAGYRLPYNLQLARLLSTLNLLRARSEIASVSPAARLAAGLYKTPRLKYDSIPIKPDVLGQDLATSELPLLLGASSFHSPSDNEDDDDDYDNTSDNDGFCSPNPCHNGAKCKNRLYGYHCICKQGYSGKHCNTRNPCLPNPCQHDGECSVAGSSFDCSCSLGWRGEKCEVQDRCHPSPCMNGGSCTELTDGYDCTCLHGFRGANCQDRSGSCSPNPCMNDGQCLEKPGGGYECMCRSGFGGAFCSAQGKCARSPCLNGGKCIETLSGTGYECSCLPGYRGQICEDMSPCQTSTCHNGGTCFESDNGFHCMCRPGFDGRTCEVRHSCQADTCRNGARCVEHESGFKCVCTPGYKGLFCDDEDRCHPNPCQNSGECVESESGYRCHCQPQYKGAHCDELDMCAQNLCRNGGQCISYQGGFKCLCQTGYTGDTCQDKSLCEPSPCHNGGSCSHENGQLKCACRRGYTGDKCELVDSCLSNPCQNGGSCSNMEGGFTCTCPAEYKGTFCNEKEPCHPNPCRNGGKCLSTSSGYVCRCREGFTGDICADEDECEPNPCQNGGRCVARYGSTGFGCECSLGYRGGTCKERDPCHPNPCANNGFCSEIGGGFSCNCSLGFKGSTCAEINACLPNPCQHHGVCREVVGGQGFACECKTGYKGFQCEARDRCHPNPCLHDGYCMEINDELGFLCNCSTGFRGNRCQNNDPCFPNPCANAGSCIHTSSDGGFVCNCSIGYKGQTCHARDLCKPNPCQFGDKCIQEGSDSYQCVKKMCEPNPCLHGRCIEVNDDEYQCACDEGFIGKNCNARDHCHDNPCMNGGTCVTITNPTGYKCACADSFKGANCSVSTANADSRHAVPTTKATEKEKDFCQPNPCHNNGECESRDTGFNCKCSNKYTGSRCQTVKKSKAKPKPQKEEQEDALIRSKVDYCTPNPCKNKGVCVQEGQGYMCACKPGFLGFHCQVSHCDLNPCKNGRCVVHGKSGYKCVCHKGFVGKNCDENYCVPNPCANGGICRSVADKGYQCKCREGFNGPHCERSPCAPNPCINGGTCVVFYTVYLCKCPKNYRGTKCEASLIGNPDVKSHVDETAVRKATQPQVPPIAVHIEPHHPIKASKCNPDPCKNDGVCLETVDGGYECFCRGDFSGPKCEDTGEYTYSSAPKFFPGPGEECHHCDRNAHCVGGHCICVDGFVGDGLDCWKERDQDHNWNCDVNPCKNGGTCKPGVGKCVCRLGYIGEYCEDYIPPSTHLSFEKVSMGTLQDDSGNDDNAILANGAQIVPHSGKCNNAVRLSGGDILFDGAHFVDIPRSGITIATWLKLDTTRGVQSIFDTVGSHSEHKDGQYHLEVDDGKVRWFHRNESHDTIFSVLTPSVLPEGKWTQLSVTYSAKNGRARVFVDGDMMAEEKGSGLLSQDWAGKAGIGKHEHVFGSRLLRGMVDEFYIFPGELPRLEILVLMRHCKLYFSKSHDHAQKATVGGPSFFSPFSPGIQNYIHPVVHSAYPANNGFAQRLAPAPRPYQQPYKSSDKIANNLEKILDSFEDEQQSIQRKVLPQPRIQVMSGGFQRISPAYGILGNMQARPMTRMNAGRVSLTGTRGNGITGVQPYRPPVTRMKGYQGRQQHINVMGSVQPHYVGFARNRALSRQGIAYSRPPLLSRKPFRMSSQRRIKQPMRYTTGEFVPVKASPVANFAGRRVSYPFYRSSQRQYYYKNPPSIQRAATGVLNTWFKSASARPAFVTPQQKTVAPRVQYNAMPRKQLQRISSQSPGQPVTMMASRRPWFINMPYRSYTPQVKYKNYLPVSYTRAPALAHKDIPALGRNQVTPYMGMEINVPPYHGYVIQSEASQQKSTLQTTAAKQNQYPPRHTQTKPTHTDTGGKYVENLQGILDRLRLQRPGVTKNIDPSKYLAFKLNPAPATSNDPVDLYEPAVKQLDNALQQLMDKRQVQFKPEQLKFIMELLEKAIRKLEPSDSSKQTVQRTVIASPTNHNTIRFLIPQIQTVNRNVVLQYPRKRTFYSRAYGPITFANRVVPYGQQIERVRYLAKRLSKVLKRKRKALSERKRRDVLEKKHNKKK